MAAGVVARTAGVTSSLAFARLTIVVQQEFGTFGFGGFFDEAYVFGIYPAVMNVQDQTLTVQANGFEE